MTTSCGNLAHYFPYDVKLRLLAHSRSFLANQKARNAIVGAENLLTILIDPKPHIHVKNPLSENMSTRLRMYKVLLFKFKRHLCKGICSAVCSTYSHY